MATYSDAVLEEIRNEMMALNITMQKILLQILESNRLLRKEAPAQALHEMRPNLTVSVIQPDTLTAEKLQSMRLTEQDAGPQTFFPRGPNGDTP